MRRHSARRDAAAALKRARVQMPGQDPEACAAGNGLRGFRGRALARDVEIQWAEFIVDRVRAHVALRGAASAKTSHSIKLTLHFRPTAYSKTKEEAVMSVTLASHGTETLEFPGRRLRIADRQRRMVESSRSAGHVPLVAGVIESVVFF